MSEFEAIRDYGRTHLGWSTERDRLVQEWHDTSDHAADGAPLGGYLCNCARIADRFMALGWLRAHDGKLLDVAIERSHPMTTTAGINVTAITDVELEWMKHEDTP